MARIVLLLYTLCCFMFQPGFAVADLLDFEQALELQKKGEILPLERILFIIRKEHTGRVLEIEIAGEKGKWLYEIVLLNHSEAVELVFDAKTGEELFDVNLHE